MATAESQQRILQIDYYKLVYILFQILSEADAQSPRAISAANNWYARIRSLGLGI